METTCKHEIYSLLYLYIKYIIIVATWIEFIYTSKPVWRGQQPKILKVMGRLPKKKNYGVKVTRELILQNFLDS